MLPLLIEFNRYTTADRDARPFSLMFFSEGIDEMQASGGEFELRGVGLFRGQGVDEGWIHGADYSTGQRAFWH